MISAPLPANEAARLRALRETNLLDTLPEKSFDDLVLLASQICGTPMAFVTLVDENRQWFKAQTGADGNNAPREISFCAHAILEPEVVFEVPDAARDERFFDNPMVTGELGLRFYAGAPFTMSSGETLGTLCVADRTPRRLSPSQIEALQALSRQVTAQIELRMSLRHLEKTREKLEATLEQVAAQSRTDHLTGLSNRRAFDERWSSENARSQRYQSPVSVLMMDIDNFKGYNDSFGHPAGDELLRAFAGLLQKELRPSDFPARYGGEEFVAILPNTLASGAVAFAERLRAKVEATNWQFRRVTVSIGVASAPPHDLGGDDLLVAADKALYAAKSGGRNRVVCDEFSLSLPKE